MFTSNLHGALLRKELRQLAPLVIAILLLAGACYALYELRSESAQAGTFSAGYILLGIPGLFAVGAGAMSVSQEKETRTLSWLASLPVSKDRLILTKFVAALTYLAGLWLIVVLTCVAIDSLGLGPTFRSHSFVRMDNHPIYSIWITHWIANTFYLLVCGYLTAWLFGSSMAALVAFVPLAVAPSLLRFVVAYASDPGHDFASAKYDATLGGNLLAVTTMLLPALWLMNRFATAALSPQQTRQPQNPYAATAIALDSSKQSSQSVLGPSSAMLWQFFRQNQIVFLSLCAISVIVGLPMLWFADTQSSNQRFDWESLSIFGTFVVTAWMGLLVFQGDNLQNRIRYLAELGVQPTKAWIMRLLLPLGYIGLVVLYYALILSRHYEHFPEQYQPPLWFVFWGLLITFGYSQWFAQLVRNPILSVIGGPVVAGLGLSYCSYASVELTSVVHYAILLTMAPFMATFLLMRRWMDRRFQWQYWCSHLAILLFVVAAPVVDLAWRVWQSPHMPEDVKVALREQAKSIAANPWGEPTISLAGLSQAESYVYHDLPLEQRIERASKAPDTDEQVQALEGLLQASLNRALQLQSSDLRILVGRVVLARARLEQTDDDSAARGEYRLQVKLLATIAQGLRRSVNLMAQETADLAEIALIAELQLPGAKERLSTEAWKDYVALVSDAAARNRARRKAVIASWAEFDAHDSDEKLNRSLGGYHTPNSQYRSSVGLLLIRNRMLDHMAWTLLRYLEAGPTASDAEKLALLQQRLPHPLFDERTQFISATWVKNPADFKFPLNVSTRPGDQWFAGWEQVGAELATIPASD